MDLSYEPIHPITRQFHLSNAYARWLMGPVGCGKSYAINWEILIRAAQQPLSKFNTRRSRVLFVRNTRQQLIDSVLPILREVFPEGRIGTWRASDSVYQLRAGEIECDIMLRPLEDDADVKRVLSINATFCVFDEWRELPLSTIRQVAARAGRYPAAAEEGCAFAGIFGASNPPGEDSDWHELLEKTKPAGWEIYRFPSARSAEATWRKFLRPDYYEQLAEGATPDFIRVMIDGEYGRSLLGRPVYEKTFNPDFHVAKTELLPIRDPQYPLCVGMDFGRTPAAVVFQRDPMGRINILSECWDDNMGLETFLKTKLRPHLNSLYPGLPLFVAADPAGWQKSQLSELCAADVLRMNDFPRTKAPTNDPEKRIQAVERALSYIMDGKALVQVDPRCKRLVQGFRGGYKYKRKKDGTYEPRPEKDEYSHVHDAAQYGFLCIDGQYYSKALRGASRRDVAEVSYAGWT